MMYVTYLRRLCLTKNLGPLARSFSSHLLEKEYDIVVVGGGMVGFGFTAFAAQYPMLRNKKILLLESATRKEYVKTPSHHRRVVALTPISRTLLEGVNAWNTIENTRIQVIHRMKVIENGSNASLLLERSNPRDVMGWIVENDLVVSALRASVDKAAAESGSETRPGCIHVIYNAAVEKYTIPTSFNECDLPELTVKLRDTDKTTIIRSNLLVGADGFKSNVRKSSGIHTIGWEHDQSAIIANLHLGDDYDYTVAWQRFLETGPIAFLPFGPNRCSITWSTTRAEAKRLMALSDDDFVSEINHCMSQPSYRPSGVVSAVTSALRSVMSVSKKESFVPPKILKVEEGTRTEFPLSFSHCTFYHAPRVALIGDAAHRILPLSGQGVNMGFGDASCLAENINQALLSGEDLGNPQRLARFTSERQRSVVPMGAFIEFIQALYSPDEVFGGPLNMNGPNSPSRATLRRIGAKLGISDAVLGIRGFGLDFVDWCSPVKRFFVESAVKGRAQFPSFRP